ncbi:ATP-binding protein [Streptomyces sp. NPDC053560]|uniref:ATP-binding protein n=1 Tax=Streptomyces sp. NPDC053560 TaxID=3365711 RepID=UPI0037D6720A
MVEPYVADALYAPVPLSAGQARAWVADKLHQLAPLRCAPAGLAECVSELVTNAVQHGPAGYDFRVRLEVSEVDVRFGVHDFGRRLPRICRLCEKNHEAEHGRGLIIVREYADAWGVESDPRGGKTVWCLFKTGIYAAGVARLDAAYRRAPLA